MEIDFIVMWVDMDDPAWRADFAKYSGLTTTDNSRNETSEARFRDYGFLKYWFRGVERFAPWVRRIHFVTCGQRPDWLDTSNPRLNLVDHRDFIPAEYLPCFNSGVLESWFHRIPGLADRFVFFNDDFFLTANTPPERFFQNGLPCDIATFRFNSGGSQWAKMLRNNIAIINRHFDKREVMRTWHDKWFDPSYGSKARLNRLLRCYPRFVTLRTPHNAQPYLKSTYEKVWAAAGDELLEASTHRFRSVHDLTQELFRTWQICEGNFTPYNTYRDTRMFPLVVRPRQAIRAVHDGTYRLVCLNDNVHIRNYARMMSDLEAAFRNILPDKSGFEK
ncbi:MAG: Stealth CR1 domain-containing protein [Alistipes sp.]|jgi:hypothetical protein|nr:Stealth CR1 domain-containing protein [Alistipes sp.]